MKTPERYKQAKWDDVPPKIRQAFDVMIGGGKGIYIYGEVGSGKTHICYAIKHHFENEAEWKYLRIWNVVDLIHQIRADFDRPHMEKKQPEVDLTDPNDNKILILDDIGAEKVSEFVAETLYYIINHRYVNMLPTIFTSNYDMQSLADRIGERSASRIVEMCDVYKLTGGDRRIK